MRVIPAVLGLSAILALALFQSGSAAPLCISQFSSTVDEWLNAFNAGHSSWGLYIQPLEPAPTPAPAVFYTRNHAQYFTPASNTKLLSAAASLTLFGANATIRTSVLSSPSRVVSGDSTAAAATVDLLVVGRGDPSLTDDSLRSFAAQLKAAGITSVGSVTADQSMYVQVGPPVDPAWEWEDVMDGDGSPQWPLSINQNTLTLTVSAGASVGSACVLSWGNAGGAVPLLTDLSTQFSTIVNQAVTVPANTPDADNWIDVQLDLHSTTLTITGNLPLGGGDIGNVSTSLCVTDGTGYVLDSFLVALKQAGITVHGTVQSVTVPYQPNTADALASFRADATEVAFVVSQPFAEVVQQCMLYSINFYAETFLRLTGVYGPVQPQASVKPLSFATAAESIPYFDLAGAVPPPAAAAPKRRLKSRSLRGGVLAAAPAPAPEPTTTELTGLAAVHTILVDAVSVPTDSFQQHDGSGLSRRNLISPDALYAVILGMVNSTEYHAFRGSLPVAGESGTLIDRFIGTSVQGKAQAKTGTMTGVSSLSGYLQHPVFGDVIFVITSNVVSLSTAAREAMIDQIVVLLQNSVNC